MCFYLASECKKREDQSSPRIWNGSLPLQYLPPIGQRAKWISILGTKYKIGVTLHVGFDFDEFPKCWEIKKIFILNNNVENAMFAVSEKETLRFCERFQCYEVAAPLRKNVRIIYSRDFTCYLPLNQIKPFGQTRSKYVCMRYEIDPT